jgi:hypothetical protein
MAKDVANLGKCKNIPEGGFPIALKDRNYPYFTKWLNVSVWRAGVRMERELTPLDQLAAVTRPGRYQTPFGTDVLAQIVLLPNVRGGVYDESNNWIWRVDDVSGMSIKGCPVCGEPYTGKFEYGTEDVADRQLIGIYEHCRACRLFDAEWFAGSGWEEIAFVRMESHYSDPKEVCQVREKLRKEALQEARAMWNDKSARPFLSKIYTRKKVMKSINFASDTVDVCNFETVYEVDTTAVQVFADYLEEQEKYPLNLKAIRETQRKMT